MFLQAYLKAFFPFDQIYFYFFLLSEREVQLQFCPLITDVIFLKNVIRSLWIILIFFWHMIDVPKGESWPSSSSKQLY